MSSNMSFFQSRRDVGDEWTVDFSPQLSEFFGDGNNIPHVCPKIVDGCNTTKYVMKYPHKSALRSLDGNLVQWEN